jgi:two-component system response regulator PfeR
MVARILIIEDDLTVNQILCEKLQHSGYQVDSAHDGELGLTMARRQDYHLILLDIMMPKKDGLTVLAGLRLRKQTPVLILTARGGEEDRIQGFKSGADDYLIKPFNMTELHLRVEAILRRSNPELFSPVAGRQPQHLFEFNSQRASVRILSETATSQTLGVTLMEYDLLKALADQTGEVLTKAYLYQNVLLREFSRYDRTLDMHISKIRKKLNAAGLGVNLIKTVRGQGYCLDLTEV